MAKSQLPAIAISRLPEAIKYLVELLNRADVETARHVLEAVQIYKHDGSIRASIETIVAARKETSLKKKFDELFAR